jgi:subtilisin family serine protease
LLAKDPRITLAQPLQQFHTLTNSPAPGTYNDPLYGLQTNLVALGISAAHERSQGAGVRVALIDTGVDTRHPDLRDRIAGTRSFIAANAVSAGGYRHGTAMAGLIAAVANNRVGIVGIAPLARIEVFEACWQLKPDTDAAACNTFTLAQALAAALEARIPLVNLSIAGPADPLLAALVQNGLKRGVIFVGSAAEADAFPTNIDGVIGVGNSDGEHAGATLSAPATHVLTLRPEGQYDFESGTSVAAAEMTGMVALLLSSNSRLTSEGIVALLKGPGDVSTALARLEADKSANRLARSTH